jgi:hypothetical protein
VIDPERRERLAAAAERFLQDPAMQEIFDSLDRAYYTQWKAAQTPEARESIWYEARGLSVMRQTLHAVSEEVQIATHNREQLARMERAGQ